MFIIKVCPTLIVKVSAVIFGLVKKLPAGVQLHTILETIAPSVNNLRYFMANLPRRSMCRWQYFLPVP